MLARRSLAAPICLLVVALACGPLQIGPAGTPSPTAGAGLPPGSPAVATAPASPVASAAPATPAAGPTATPDPLAEPPPADVLDALYARVAAGEWTYEEGLVATLKIFTGESDPAALFGSEQPVTTEFSSLLAEAERYVDSGSDPATAAEVRRLLDVVAPDTERILAYAQPRPAGKRPGLAGPAPAAQPPSFECLALWQDGFPEVSPPVECFQYLEQPLPNGQVRVFYPINWWPSDPRLEWADAVAEAVLLASEEYSQLEPGEMGSVDVVFTLLEHPTAPGSKAGVEPLGNPDPCSMDIYPPSVAFVQKSGLTALQEVVAHEMFHCYAAWNLADQYDKANPATNGWWIEGAATYFMGVVIPGVNDEWGFIERFDKKSPNTPINLLAYENFIFFQSLANQGGNQSIIDLLVSLPDSDDPAAHAAALAAFPGMPDAFHQLGQDYLDQLIINHHGEALPLKPVVRPEDRLTISGGQELALEAPPLVLRRFELTFAPDREYGVDTTPSGAGSSTVRPKAEPGGWAEELPAEVGGGCDGETYLVLGTTVPPDASAYRLDVAVEPLKETACDLCLVGTWDLNRPSFEAYMSATMSNAPEFSILNIAGGWRYVFHEDATLDAAFDAFELDYEIRQTDAFGGPLVTRVLLTMNGTGSASYQTDAAGQLFTQPITQALAIEQSAWLNGDLIHSGPIDDPGAIGGNVAPHYRYTCSDTTLELQTIVPSGPQLPPVQYDRVSDPP